MKTVSTLVLLLGATFAAAETSPESKKIDELLAKDWQKSQIQPNPKASDEVLVRRLYLDIAGRVPTLDETQAYVQSSAPDKTGKLIDALLSSDGYTSHMFNFWADVLRLTDNVKGKVTAQAYEEWLKQKLKANTPFDQLVRDLLTTDGGVWDSGAVGFYMRDENKLDHLAYTSQVFLGTQIVCAQCHNHPFDKWTQHDYYQLAAYTYGMDSKGNYLDQMKKAAQQPSIDKEALKGMTKAERKEYLAKFKQEKSKMSQEEASKAQISREEAREVKEAMSDVMKPLRYTSVMWRDDKLPSLPHDYKYTDAKPGEQLPPKTLFGHDAVPQNGETKLQAFARWMTSPENPRFTMVVANRMWKRAFGVGLIEPVDEITDSTVPSNPELMDYLTQLMTEKKYSLKDFLRVIYNTDTYQRAASTKELQLGDTYHFTGPLLRRMSAEQIWDSMVTLTRGNVDADVDDENVRLNQYLADLKFFMTTIKDKGPAGLVDVARKANSANEDNLKKMEDLRKQADELIAAGDKEAAQKLAKEGQRLRREKNNDILVALMGEDRANELRRGYNEKQDQGAKQKVTKQIMLEINKLPKQERKEAIKKLKATSGATSALGSRASEQPSPARPGSFLRTFGQSDREEVDNFNRDASVPQALNLLNGPMLSALTGPASALNKRLEAETTAEGRAALIYQALLSRQPTAEESRIIADVLKERGDKALEDIAHALLTGSQFLFVQ